jgi:hypothetical protein
VSYRERRNRKDAKGKTPEQIRRGQRVHELAYAEAIKDQPPLPGHPEMAELIRAWADAGFLVSWTS